MLAREKHRAMESDDRLSCSCRSGYTRGSAVVSFNQLALRRMQKYRPLLPRKFESSLQFIGILENAESALCVGMGKRAGSNGDGFCNFRCSAGRDFQQGF